MTPPEQNAWEIIRESQIRMEGDIKSFTQRLDSIDRMGSHALYEVMHGDGTDARPGVAKELDRIKQRQSRVNAVLGMVWGVLLSAIGAIATWVLSQGTK